MIWRDPEFGSSSSGMSREASSHPPDEAGGSRNMPKQIINADNVEETWRQFENSDRLEEARQAFIGEGNDDPISPSQASTATAAKEPKDKGTPGSEGSFLDFDKLEEDFDRLEEEGIGSTPRPGMARETVERLTPSIGPKHWK